MFPIILNLTKIKIALIGNGIATERRKKGMQDAGLNDVLIFSDYPGEEKLRGIQAVFIADFDYQKSAELADKVRKLGIMVNVEDKTDLCDFHVPAIIRRGNLLITASTGAKSPRLTKRLKAYIEKIFGQEWERRVDLLAQKREKWKKEGASIKELAEKADEIIDREGWLS